MIKRKMKLVSILTIIVTALTITNVNAKTTSIKGSVSLHGTNSNSIKYGNGEPYVDWNFNVNVNGKAFEAYCVDAGYHLNSGMGVICEKVDSASAMEWLLNNLTGDHVTDQLAIRMLAMDLGIVQKLKPHGKYINDYKNGNSKALTGSNKIEKASALYEEALTNSNWTGSQTATLSFSTSKKEGNRRVLNVTSTLPIDENINFTCENCTVESQSWSGNNGTVTVLVNENECSYKISVEASPSGLYKCKSVGDNQNLVINVDAKNSDGVSGSYEENFCGPENENPNPNTCVCNQKTSINMPTLCDTGDNEATITSPTDVKCCILNEEDEAGNTYQMLDGQIKEENPYCAVYCKEDYKMTLPGAQYTDSGRYFNLQNTVVEAKRTCYLTNPKKNSEETNVDIEKFVKDVIHAQLELLKAKDEYEKAKEEARLSASPNSSTSTDCSGNVKTMYSINASNYTGFKYSEDLCDKQTGACRAENITRTTSSREWGTKVTNNSCGKCENGRIVNGSCTGTCVCTSDETTINYDFNAALTTAGANLTNALNNLKEVIDNMESCYNWINDLCLDPEVVFDYNEQYTTDINYQKVSSDIEKDTYIGFSQNKEIDNEYTTTEGANLENIHYLYCDANGCNESSEDTYAKQISTLVTHYYHMKKESDGKAEYKNIQEFQTNYPHGTIDKVTNPENLKYNYNYLGAVFPIALNTPMGVYEWKLNFTKLGQYNDAVGCKNGRLDDVAKAIGASTTADLEYVCVYVVDCDDCDYECVGEGCLIPDEPKCPECEVYCVNCIFDGTETYYMRSVTLNDINPENRSLGFNWSNEKGKRTMEEIEGSGENTYITEQYTYIITPQDQKRIQDYNKETGTYVQKDLTYHDLNGVSNAYGTSNFLDEGEKKGFFTEVKRNTTWILWQGTIGNGIGPVWQ